MKRKFVQIVALCLTAALLAPAGGGVAFAAPVESNERIIRVGLHFGTGAMEGLNLENEVGSGFHFGYYDGSNQFVTLGYTGQTAISAVKTMNVYYGTYGGYTCYHSALTSANVAVGEYHLQLPGSYSTFEEAFTVASAYSGGFPACIGGVYYARIGNYITRDRAVAAQSQLAGQGVGTELRGTSEYGVSVVATGTNTILFQYDDLGNGTGLGIEPIQTGAEKCVTLSKGKLYNGGFRFERINGGNLTVVNIVGMEDYVKGVVATEMSTSWPIEALKAQAVAARSFALSLGSKHSRHHFDICDDVDCQAYTGQTRAGTNSNAAVDQTAGQVVLCDGKIAQTFYYASNGGASENSSNVWEGNQANYPYLIGKVDPYEASAPIPGGNNWSRSFSSDTLVAKLRGLGYNAGPAIVSIAVTSLTDTGNPKRVTFTDSSGRSFSIESKDVIQKMLGLPSYRYGFETVNQQAPTPSPQLNINGTTTLDGSSGLYAIDGSGNVTPISGEVYAITGNGTVQIGQGSGSSNLGTLTSTTGSNGIFTFVGKGSGHNVGMSQWGAYAMAEMGYTYMDILQFYYTGITVGYM